MEMIRVVDMLATMQMRHRDGSLIPFEITFVTYNKKANTGGKIITLQEAILSGGPGGKNKKKDPNHYNNYTRNITAVKGDQIIKIHALLVTRFNKAKVIL